MPLHTRDDAPILRVNGIQTQSESYLDLLPETPCLVADGVTHLRLMPQAVDMVAVASVFRDVLGNDLPVEEADHRLGLLSRAVNLSNGFYYGSAGYRRIAIAVQT